MSQPHGVDGGAIAAILGAVISALVAIGGGIAWFAGWMERRASSRAQKLQAWHDELRAKAEAHQRREDEFDSRVEHRLAELEGQNRALRYAFELVAAPLRVFDPNHPGLLQAEQILAAAFPLAPIVPPAMTAQLAEIDKRT